MADNPRLESLRRRVQQDPSSIAFAQLGEEYRRAGQLQEAVDVCRAGLEIHPAYISARVTLGRALLELQQFDQAQLELEQVVKSAPENLAAIRGLAEAHHRQGSLVQALAQYRAALAIAHHDPDLEHIVNELAGRVETAPVREPLSTPLAAHLGDVNPVEREKARALATVAALEHWLHAVHVARAELGA
jgi:tetratricopeptide (TPR) repeat protein